MKAQRKQRMLKKVAGHFRNRLLSKAWDTWAGHHAEMQRQKTVLSKAAVRMRNLTLAQAWAKWFECVGACWTQHAVHWSVQCLSRCLYRLR